MNFKNIISRKQDKRNDPNRVKDSMFRNPPPRSTTTTVTDKTSSDEIK